MNKLRYTVIIALIGFLSFSFSQHEKFNTIKIKTSAICGECKERIENKLNYTKGIVFADLDLETNLITVKYKTKKLTTAKIKGIVSLIGYHADEVERNKEAFNNLPACCKDPNASCTKE